MNFLIQAFEILKLNKQEILNISQDESATKKGIIILIILGFILASIKAIKNFDIFTFLSYIPIPLIVVFIASIAIKWCAKLLGGKERSYKELFRPLSYIYILSTIAYILPDISQNILTKIVPLTIYIWIYVVEIIIVKNLYDFSKLRSFFTLILSMIFVIIAGILIFFIFLIITIIFGAAIWGSAFFK